ncbi:MAG: C10 family peptidase [Bacteroidales bacterium]|nr:C10 family peptidase [Candidatus Physcousia equi]
MTKQILFLLFAWLLCGLSQTHARELSSEEALARIMRQWNNPTASMRRAPVKAGSFALAATGCHPISARPTYYIYNRAGGGFVVASANDELPAMLAVVDDGQYEAATMPDGFKAWLTEVASMGVCATPAHLLSSELPSSVAPLLNKDMIAWGQQTPYNKQCPKFRYNDYDYETLAGCAAIAMGQIMRYHQWPDAGQGETDYDSFVYVQDQEIKTHVSRSLGSYDWSKILGNYQYTTYTNEQSSEVAHFVSDVACAIHMNFDPTASATTDLEVAKALKQNFGYDPSLQLIDHSYFTTEQWANILRSEIANGRPVYLSGANVTNTPNGDAISGHAFVCDGYSEDGTFHINWGWNGTANGDFYLTALNPRNQGAGGSAGGYSFMANAIIGIKPNHNGNTTEALPFLSLAGDYWETSYDSEVAGGGYRIYFTLANPTATDFEGFVAIRIMEDDDMLMHPKQMAWKLECKAGSSGTLGKGLLKDYFLQHPTARLELVYAHCPGVNTADEATQVAMLEAIDDDAWQPLASRLGAPRSLQTFVDAQNRLSFGPNANEVFQLRLAGLTSDTTPQAGVPVQFTATITNESDYEYFAPLYLFLYDSAGRQVGYSNYDLHLLPAHATKQFRFQVTVPSGDCQYAVAYEDKSYEWNYVPMPLYQNETHFSTSLFDALLDPTVYDEEAPDLPSSDGENAYQPAKGARAYYLKNVDSGYYLNVVDDERNCALLSETKEVIYFEPTTTDNEYIIKGHTGLYLGGCEENTFSMSSHCPETWIVEKQEDGSIALRAKSNQGAANSYIGFDTPNFVYYALGAKAKRNQRYASAHGLFCLETADTDPEDSKQDGVIMAVGDPVPEQTTEGSAHLFGDVDQNRKLETADVEALLQVLLRKKEVTPECDIDLNRIITIRDLVKLVKHLLLLSSGQ